MPPQSASLSSAPSLGPIFGGSYVKRHSHGTRKQRDAQSQPIWLPQAPLVEETLKLLTVLAVLGLAGRHGGRDWLVGGMCVGMGFQLNEDLGYIVDQVASAHHGYETAVAVTLGDRVSGALVSHWTYTALAAVAVWLYFCQRRRLRGLLLVLTPLLSHAAWDTPLSDAGALFEALICLIAANPVPVCLGRHHV